MAKDKQHKGSPTTGSTARSGSSAQQEQGGDGSQQGGARRRDDADEMPDEGAQSGSSPRSRSESPDEGKAGERT